ncbi:hypothetical protein MRS44_005596 [Fusarium solani]|uniref:uncharacterized protein n=1 Tax=Fusarium solani TaxID=169388 RepID=UPI0032C4A907|nr:hypothetical protein MRS44_005596 [Fusarium solani]
MQPSQSSPASQTGEPRTPSTVETKNFKCDSWATGAHHETKDVHLAGSCVATEQTDIIINTDESSHNIKYMGSSSLQGLAVFIDLRLGRHGYEPISPLFRYGMRHAEDLHLPLNASIPDLPALEVVDNYTSAFFNAVWPLFPVLDMDAFRSELKDLHELLQLRKPERLEEILSTEHVPLLATAFSVMSIGADEMAGDITEVGSNYLTAAYGFFAHLVASPHLGSVQALVLLSIALRGRGKDGQAWHTIGQAVRISHSIGLHRHLRPHYEQRPERPDDQLRSRVWWSCYAMEKMLQLETGRPAGIMDGDNDLPFPDLSPESDAGGNVHYLAIWVSLARVLGRISEHIYGKPDSAFSLLYETGKLDECLQDWAASVPEGFRPGSEIFTDQGMSSALPDRIVIFCSLQFYQAQITLLRASLILPSRSYDMKIMEFETSLPSRHRLLQSRSTCINASRSIVNLGLELLDRGTYSQLLTPTPVFLATAMLALNILSSPQKRTARSDLELFTAASETCEHHYRRLGQDERFIGVLAALRTRVRDILKANGDTNLTGHPSDHPTGDPSSFFPVSVPDLPLTPQSSVQSFDIPPSWVPRFELGNTDLGFVAQGVPEMSMNSMASCMSFEQLFAFVVGNGSFG